MTIKTPVNLVEEHLSLFDLAELDFVKVNMQVCPNTAICNANLFVQFKNGDMKNSHHIMLVNPS